MGVKVLIHQREYFYHSKSLDAESDIQGTVAKKIDPNHDNKVGLLLYDGNRKEYDWH